MILIKVKSKARRQYYAVISWTHWERSNGPDHKKKKQKVYDKPFLGKSGRKSEEEEEEGIREKERERGAQKGPTLNTVQALLKGREQEWTLPSHSRECSCFLNDPSRCERDKKHQKGDEEENWSYLFKTLITFQNKNYFTPTSLQ